MTQVPSPRRPETVRVVIDDAPGLDDRVRAATRRARDKEAAVELVEPLIAADDHDAIAALNRRMDLALAVARQAGPGVDIRVRGRPRVPAQPAGDGHPEP